MMELKGALRRAGGLSGRVAIGAGGGASSWGDLTGKPFETLGSGLTVIDGALSVDTADAPEPDNTKPITAAAVYTEVGNINALLATI